MPREIIDFVTEYGGSIRTVIELLAFALIIVTLLSSHLSRLIGEWLQAHSDGILAYRRTKQEKLRRPVEQPAPAYASSYVRMEQAAE